MFAEHHITREELFTIPQRGDTCLLLDTPLTFDELAATCEAAWRQPHQPDLTVARWHCGNRHCANRSHFFFTRDPSAQMATIDDLQQKSVTDMTEEELVERLRELRQNRRNHQAAARSKPTSKSAKVKSAKPAADTDDLDMAALQEATAGMSMEERVAFLKKIGIL